MIRIGLRGPRSHSQYSNPLRAGRFADRILEGARFSAPGQICPGAHPASCKMGTGSLSRRVKRLGRGLDHPPPSGAEVKKKIRAILLLPLWVFMACHRVNFNFTFYEWDLSGFG